MQSETFQRTDEILLEWFPYVSCFQNFSGTFRGEVKIPTGLMFVLLSELWNTKQGMGRIIKMSV